MLAEGTRLGRYRLIRALGSGGMADVYEAEDAQLGRRVALKVLPAEFARRPQFVQRFEDEVRKAASLNHGSIVPVFDFGLDNGMHYYSMRLLSGGSLRTRIDQGLTAVEALTILRDVADALGHAHASQPPLIHRDVKPENILFDERGHAMLTDFGIAKAMDQSHSMTATGIAIGSARYMSPEQARGRKDVDARSDLYSLGAMFYEMLTGAPPYDGDDQVSTILMHITDPIPRLPAESARYQRLIDWLMAKTPEQRPASAADVVAWVDDELALSGPLPVGSARIAARAPSITASVQPTVPSFGSVLEARRETRISPQAPPAAAGSRQATLIATGADRDPSRAGTASATTAAAAPRRGPAVAAGAVGLALIGAAAWTLYERTPAPTPADESPSLTAATQPIPPSPAPALQPVADPATGQPAAAAGAVPATAPATPPPAPGPVVSPSPGAVANTATSTTPGAAARKEAASRKTPATDANRRPPASTAAPAAPAAPAADAIESGRRNGPDVPAATTAPVAPGNPASGTSERPASTAPGNSPAAEPATTPAATPAAAATEPAAAPVSAPLPAPARSAEPATAEAPGSTDSAASEKNKRRARTHAVGGF